MQRAALAFLAVAACTKATPPHTAIADGSPHLAAAAAVDAGAAAVAPTPDANQKGTAMTPEALIAAHYEQIGWGAPKNLVAYPHVPGLYRAEWPDGLDYVIVKDGALVPPKTGLDGMSAFMKDVKLLSAQVLDVDEMIRLVLFFDAWPSQFLRDNYYQGPEHKTLQPKLELGVGEARLTLAYIDTGSSGARQNPKIVKVTLATLTLAKDYKLSWKSEQIDFDTTK